MGITRFSSVTAAGWKLIAVIAVVVALALPLSACGPKMHKFEGMYEFTKITMDGMTYPSGDLWPGSTLSVATIGDNMLLTLMIHDEDINPGGWDITKGALQEISSDGTKIKYKCFVSYHEGGIFQDTGFFYVNFDAESNTATVSGGNIILTFSGGL
ncbi:MAG: hypothetical protein IKD70_03195 [Eggerthellaceae bacterium]|nr:hypothetical protein [Eggerthellaceae bacterium]